jgi:hypothetical protein
MSAEGVSDLVPTIKEDMGMNSQLTLLAACRMIAALGTTVRFHIRTDNSNLKQLMVGG